MSAKTRRRIGAGVSIAMLGLFAGLYGWAFWLVFTSAAQPVEFPPEFIYIATALAGLVGGVAAMIFNEQLPDDPAGPKAHKDAPPTTPSESGRTAAWIALKRSVYPDEGGDKLFSILSALYVIVYFVVGIFAIVTWVYTSKKTPNLVTNLALISIGLFVAIARSFFHVPKTSS